MTEASGGVTKEGLGIFLSYRREDSAGHAGRLYDRLVRDFSGDRVFIDVERIDSGEDFARVIETTMRACDVCIVVVGKRWLTAADQYGMRRLDKSDDWVRIEVGAALTRSVRVIPVLVDDAALPPPEALPGDLARLPSLQAYQIHHLTFHQDVDRLIAKIRLAVDSRRAALTRTASLAAGTVRMNSQDGLEYVWVPPGDFLMGRVRDDRLVDQRYDDEKPQHPVHLTRGFWLSRGPVTVAAYKLFAHKRGLTMPPPVKDNPGWVNYDHPIVNVTWAQAREYCASVAGRLPTEAQWEYAARGGAVDTVYPWGNDIRPQHANYADNGDWHGTSPVGSFPPNRFNLHDMVGNVWEWVTDWYDDAIYATRSPQSPTEDPEVCVDKLRKRVVRGGSWDSIAIEARVSNRGFQTPLDGFRDFGFRCLVDDLDE